MTTSGPGPLAVEAAITATPRPAATMARIVPGVSAWKSIFGSNPAADAACSNSLCMPLPGGRQMNGSSRHSARRTPFEAAS